MGSRGPVPKRSTERIRRNADSKAHTVNVAGEVRPPGASRSWHPRARAWFRSLAQSGQSKFYEPSDWQTAAVMAEVLTQLLGPRPSAEMLKAWLSGVEKLGATEGARRRLRIEVNRQPTEEPEDEPDSADVAVLDQYRRLAGG